MNDELLEPLKAYKSKLEKEFADNAAAMFQEMVERSKIDVAQNRATAKAYRGEIAIAEKIAAKLSAHKSLRGFLIFLTVAGFLTAAVGIYLLVQAIYLAGGLCLGLGAGVGAAMLGVIFGVLNGKIKNFEQQRQKHLDRSKKLLEECNRQMAALNSLFDSNMTKKLIEKTVPLLKIDDNFSMRRYDYLSGKYGFPIDAPNNRSTIGILTGEILGNPFVVDRELVSFMGSETYWGHLVITWTTTYTDSEGNVHTQTHTQTLTASVTKPMPRFKQETRLIYGNEAAPDLSFTHEPSHAEDMSENQLERHVKRGSKKIRKKQDKALKKGTSNFTGMGNEEFDVLFGALDRNNEVQFRLLFTPLAQQNMLALMKDDYGFGDDFHFAKRGCLNYVSSEHSAQWDMDTDYTKFYSYDADISRSKFMEFNKQYFKSLFFDLAPLLSIPLYQQMKPHEYIYKDSYGRNYTAYEAEFMANAMGRSAFAPAAAKTDSILKSAIISKDGQSDSLEITAYSYRTEPRVDFVPVFGGDGMMHNVPVPWDEYIPIQKSSTVKLKELGLTGREFAGKLSSTPLKDALDRYGKATYAHGLLCCMVAAADGNFDEEINKFLNK